MKTIAMLSVALLPFFLFTCKTEQYTANNLPETQLRFGNGGGFVGAFNEYVLLENGQLFKREQLDGPLIELPKVKKKKAKALFEQMTEMNFQQMERNAPGNMYRFMSCQTKTDSNKVTWGSTEKIAVDESLDSLYQLCIKLIE